MSSNATSLALVQAWQELREEFLGYFPEGTDFLEKGHEFQVMMDGQHIEMCFECDEFTNDAFLSRANVSARYEGHNYGTMAYALFAVLTLKAGHTNMFMFSNKFGTYHWLKAGASLQAQDGVDWPTLSYVLTEHLKAVEPYFLSQDDYKWFIEKACLRCKIKDLWDISDSGITINHGKYRRAGFAILANVTVPLVHDFTSQPAMDRLLGRLEQKQPEFAAQIAPRMMPMLK